MGKGAGKGGMLLALRVVTGVVVARGGERGAGTGLSGLAAGVTCVSGQEQGGGTG